VAHVVTASQRLPVIDGLRAVAVMAVVIYHVLTDPLRVVWPAAGAVSAEGFLGVQVFFVISGFVLMRALITSRIDASFGALFLLRRLARLTPPYWASIALACAVWLAADAYMRPGLTSTLTVKAVAANAAYLQYVLGEISLQPLYWTLCFEVQFYLAVVVLVAISKQLAGWLGEQTAFLVTFVPLLVYSVLVARGWASTFPGAAFGGWYCFFLGVAAERALRADDWTSLLLALAAAAVVGAVNVEGLVGAVTALFIVFSIRRKKERVWLAGPMTQWLGRISYSIYLTHSLIELRSYSMLQRSLGHQPWLHLLAAFGVMLVAIAFAYVFWWAVERPSLALSRRVSARPA
jgi:peptidoglycan/LPS O-acetylase OafA/YrhL